MSSVYFDQSHWRAPRDTIASIYKENDYGYVFHATSILIDVLEFSNLTVLQCKGLNVLDYGCGTGRVARQFALTGAKVVGFDPTKECIDEAMTEFQKVGDRYKSPALLTHRYEEIGHAFDLIYCVNVIEHLPYDDAVLAIQNIESLLADGGQAILWVHSTKNKHFSDKHSLDLLDVTPGVSIVRGVKTSGTVTYTKVRRK